MITTMVDLERFLPRLNLAAPGCPTPTLRDAVLWAAREFCERTWLWEGELVPVQTQEDVLEYKLFAVAADILAVKQVALDGRDAAFSTPARDVVRLWADPGEGLDLVATAVLAPAADGTQVPERLWTEWRDAVEAGALSRVLRLQGGEWFDPAGADKHKLEFERHWAPRARVELAYRSDKPLRVSKRRFC